MVTLARDTTPPGWCYGDGVGVSGYDASRREVKPKQNPPVEVDLVAGYDASRRALNFKEKSPSRLIPRGEVIVTAI